MPYIYKITNDIDSNIYIGKTNHENPHKRFKEHLNDSKKERCKNRQLYKLMNLYGQEHFYFDVIEEVEDDEIACLREAYWIEYYDTYKNGLNGTLGGDGKVYLKLNEEEVIEYHCEVADYIVGRTSKYFNVDKKTIKKILERNNITWINSKEFNTTFKGREIMRVDQEGSVSYYDTISLASQVVKEELNLKGCIKAIASNISRAIKVEGSAYGSKWFL